jgi:hypothetical protein
VSFTRRVARPWIPLAVAVTLLAALLYGSVQQTYRTGADDPQVQLAQDGAARPAAGARPSSVAGSSDTSTVDIAAGLAPFVIVFDRSGTAVASSGELNGLAGRTLREAEARVQSLTMLVGARWLFTLFATLVGIVLVEAALKPVGMPSAEEPHR